MERGRALQHYSFMAHARNVSSTLPNPKLTKLVRLNRAGTKLFPNAAVFNVSRSIDLWMSHWCAGYTVIRKHSSINAIPMDSSHYPLNVPSYECRIELHHFETEFGVHLFSQNFIHFSRLPPLPTTKASIAFECYHLQG